ncbi:hypothetical protein L861_07380 [Litchfieldella anticariensis FP35 = DSM 16096]|uniref:Uncharacterized protein n=1 Tax=Litchfieldella anticariensis (strain DSM 16096 / CECT 5854 / CIP 108499 / LMG 22089 / FP35) TaxID=1121939 RepID=S2KEM3_LITA3|nr:hypothetical protein [Halomonas anticariensis]EPC00310.1 hypothetical protein L861_07380 [Halomonas anticariensis FP35 = DSM 16096]
MSKQTRIEPIFEADDLHETIIGWVVIDESQPDNEVVVSEHESRKEAIQGRRSV